MPPLTLPLIERLVKTFKTHPTQINFNAGCVNGFVQVLQGVRVNSEPSKGAIIVIVSKALCFAIFAVFCL
jgi:hypothetical protein